MPEYNLADIFAPRLPAKAIIPPLQEPLAGIAPPLRPTNVPGAATPAVAGMRAPAGAGAPGATLADAFAPDGTPTEALLDRIRMIESGGDDYAVSPAGARGPFQIMPATGADPGYGVAPISGPAVNDPTKAREWARAYLAAMMRKYQNPMLAVAAYNAGPGTIDAAVAGGGYSQFPAETQAYVRKAGVY